MRRYKYAECKYHARRWANWLQYDKRPAHEPQQLINCYDITNPNNTVCVSSFDPARYQDKLGKWMKLGATITTGLPDTFVSYQPTIITTV